MLYPNKTKIRAAAIAAALVLSQPISKVWACVGDCDGRGQVAVNNIVMLIGIVLGEQPAEACAHGLPGGSEVDVTVIVKAVNHALDGCPVPTQTETETVAAATETPSPTQTEMPTAIPSSTPTEAGTPAATATPTSTSTPRPTSAVSFCSLPGSVLFTEHGREVVPGGPARTPDLEYLDLPVGFCAHFYANVGNVRQLRFAPGGELFAASPSRATTSFGQNGRSAIVVLPDDDQDGFADSTLTFLGGMPATQGLMFANGYFYYQNDTKILRMPYAAGERVASEDGEVVVDVQIYKSFIHWPKSLDIADDGTIYVTNGGDQGDPCDRANPFHGGILEIDGSPGGRPVAKGMRNPINMRCSRGHNLCFALELSRDYSWTVGGREKLFSIHDGDDWGFPCCATKDVRYPDSFPNQDCSDVVAEYSSFYIGDTPFDLDFETGAWPAPWTNRVFVPLHGAYGTWEGARLVAIEVDPVTGQPQFGTDLGGMSSGAMADFATGWDDNSLLHGRPGVVAFASDGRLFLGNDINGDIIWIAPQ